MLSAQRAARYKPGRWHPDSWRVLCSYQNCREELAGVSRHEFYSGEVQFTLTFAGGYRRDASGRWALGRHAARSPRHAPRRPLRSGRTVGVVVARGRRGDLMTTVADRPRSLGSPRWDPFMPVAIAWPAQRDTHGHRSPIPSTQAIPLSDTEPVVVVCPRCGAHSVIRAVDAGKEMVHQPPPRS